MGCIVLSSEGRVLKLCKLYTSFYKKALWPLSRHKPQNPGQVGGKKSSEELGGISFHFSFSLVGFLFLSLIQPWLLNAFTFEFYNESFLLYSFIVILTMFYFSKLHVP